MRCTSLQGDSLEFSIAGMEQIGSYCLFVLEWNAQVTFPSVVFSDKWAWLPAVYTHFPFCEFGVSVSKLICLLSLYFQLVPQDMERNKEMGVVNVWRRDQNSAWKKWKERKERISNFSTHLLSTYWIPVSMLGTGDGYKRSRMRYYPQGVW